MGFGDIAERAAQDTANLSTMSGVNGSGIVGFIAQQLPGPSIQRGFNNLRSASTLLKEHVVPVDLEKKFFKQHDKLFHAGEALMKEKETLGRWKALKLYGRASNFENKTYGLRTDVQMSSDYHSSRQSRRYTPSEHTIDSTWEVPSRPSSPAPAPTPSPTTGGAEASSSGQQASSHGQQASSESSGQPEEPSAPSGSTTSPDTLLSERVTAGQLLATVEEEPSEGASAQENIPLDVVGPVHPLGTDAQRSLLAPDCNSS